MIKNRKISRSILILVMLIWAYYLTKSKFPFEKNWYITILASIIYALIAVSLHRWIQDITAIKAGDISQKIQKKNLAYFFRNLDIVGFLCFPIFGVGWSNPTISPKALTGNHTGQRVWILFSGCLANLIVSLIAQFLIYPSEFFSLFLASQLSLFSQINMFYFLISLLPIPPLDGWLIYKAIRKQRVKIEQETFYGEVILVISMITYIIPWSIEKIAQSIMYWI